MHDRTKDALGRTVSRRSFVGYHRTGRPERRRRGDARRPVAAAAAAGRAAAPAEQGDAATGQGGTVTWGTGPTRARPSGSGEVSKDYEAEYQTKVTFQIVTGDYTAKLLTQLAGGSAPDAFYVNTEGMAKLIESKNIIDLTEFADKPDSPVKIEDFYPGLLPWCTGHGKGTYGLPVDCNPLVFWFNQDMLAAAGIEQNPVAAVRGRHLEPGRAGRVPDQDQGHRQARHGDRRRSGRTGFLDDHLRRHSRSTMTTRRI